MAPFVHCTRLRPSRFSDRSYSVYYAGSSFDVVLHETIYHFERRMMTTAEPPMDADFRGLLTKVDRKFHDLRSAATYRKYHHPDPDKYGHAQALAASLRKTGSDGLVYRSVRYPAGDTIRPLAGCGRHPYAGPASALFLGRYPRQQVHCSWRIRLA